MAKNSSDDSSIEIAKLQLETSLKNEKSKSTTAITVALIGTLSGWGVLFGQNYFGEKKFTTEELNQAVQDARPQQLWLRLSKINSSSPVPIRLLVEVEGAVFIYPSKAIWITASDRAPQADFPLPLDQDGYSMRVSAISDSGKTDEIRRYSSTTVRFPVEVTSNVISVRLDGVTRISYGGIGGIKDIPFQYDSDELRLEFEVVTN